MATQTTVQQERTFKNGVDVTGILEAIEHVTQDPAAAEFRFRNENKWIDGGLNRSTIKSLYGAFEERPHRPEFVFENDEPQVLLGSDKAPNPVEWILHAMAGCITTTTVYHAAVRGIRIDEMSTKLEGDLDLRGILNLPGPDTSGYKSIKMAVSIKGDAPKQDLEELVALALSLSPAVSTVIKPTKVELTVNVA